MTNETTLPELLPCPFCGGPVQLEQAYMQRHHIYGERKSWGVACRNTSNRGGSCCMEQVPSASKEAAIDRWNMRKPMDALRAELEQCREDALGDLREQVMGMQEAAYTFGENCKEAVVVALDGVIEAIDAARGAK